MGVNPSLDITQRPMPSRRFEEFASRLSKDICTRTGNVDTLSFSKTVGLTPLSGRLGTELNEDKYGKDRMSSQLTLLSGESMQERLRLEQASVGRRVGRYYRSTRRLADSWFNLRRLWSDRHRTSEKKPPPSFRTGEVLLTFLPHVSAPRTHYYSASIVNSNSNVNESSRDKESVIRSPLIRSPLVQYDATRTCTCNPTYNCNPIK